MDKRKEIQQRVLAVCSNEWSSDEENTDVVNSDGATVDQIPEEFRPKCYPEEKTEITRPWLVPIGNPELDSKFSKADLGEILPAVFNLEDVKDVKDVNHMKHEYGGVDVPKREDVEKRARKEETKEVDRLFEETRNILIRDGWTDDGDIDDFYF